MTFRYEGSLTPPPPQPVGPSGSPLVQKTFDTPSPLRRIPNTGPIRYGTILSGSGRFPDQAELKAIQLDIDRPSIFQIVNTLAGSYAGGDVDFIQVWYAPEIAPYSSPDQLPWIRGVGTRVWLPSPGRWWVLVNTDTLDDKFSWMMLDASNEAWATTYMATGLGTAADNLGGFGAAQAIAVASEIIAFNIAVWPDAHGALIRNLTANPCVVNQGGSTVGGTLGFSLGANGLIEISRQSWTAGSIYVWSTAGSSVELFITLR